MLNQPKTGFLKRKSLSAGQVAGFGLLIYILVIFVHILILIGMSVVETIKGSALPIATIAGSGFYIALITILGGIIGTALIILITRYYQGSSFTEYLGLTRISLKRLGVWLLIAIIYLTLMDTCSYLLKRPIVPEFMNKVVQTARFPWLLYFAFIVAAPVFEELFFRGFLYKGLSNSRLKSIGAILLTSFCWSLLHTQYDRFIVFQIFLGGVLLGFARLKTGSVYVTIGMHALQNLVATIETLVMSS